MSTVASINNQVSVTINGTVHTVAVNESITLTDDNVVSQTVTVPTSETQIGTVGTVGPGGLADVKYGLIINRDGTNFIRVRLADTSGHTMDVKLLAGEYFVLHNRSLNVSTSEGAFSAFSDIDTISAQADTASCDVEIILLY